MKIRFDFCVLILLGTFATASRTKCFSQEAKTPVVFSTQEDHQDMMRQLGITKLRPGPSGNNQAPNAANYDEALANPYPDLPDVMNLNSGEQVRTPEQWWKQRRPEIVDVNTRGKAAITVKQSAYPVALESKTNLLLHLLEQEEADRVLVFTRTRRGAERLATLLAARKHQVNRIHADRTQPQREAALRGFRDGRFRVLVATDIAARGIDVDSISHVINFDVPDAAEDYIHRIGRTGRAGNEGRALTLLTPVDELSMMAIEKLTGQLVERIVVPGFGGKMPIVDKSSPMRGARRSSSGFRSFNPRRFGSRRSA